MDPTTLTPALQPVLQVAFDAGAGMVPGLPLPSGRWQASLTWTEDVEAYRHQYCAEANSTRGVLYTPPHVFCWLTPPGDPDARWAYGCTACGRGSPWGAVVG